ACNKNKSASASNDAQSAQSAQAPAALTTEPTGPAMHIDPDRAWQYTKEIVAIGPRWDGSKGQEKLGAYLHAHFKTDVVGDDVFVANTPAGKIPMRNIIVKLDGTKDGIIVLASHIDTNYALRKTSYVGANDGASSTALLMAIADQLRGKKLEGYSVWLAFLDGEEAVREWTDEDSLYGSKHLAAKWQQDGTIRKIKAFILADMIGDKDLDILRDDGYSAPWLEELVYRAAERLGHQSHFFLASSPMEDDHKPFAIAGAPVADLIDYDYGYNNAFHHTTEDTLDKLSPKSLQITGDVILETIRLLNANADHLPAGVPFKATP
ncbi:MAG TPA: M28 family peptidase, partial [Candidatus Angelobacter sp.]|nr:M28 family peptidase [Candidatus Angelobacter sp.]